MKTTHIVILSAIAFFCSPLFSQHRSSGNTEYVKGEILVKFKNTVKTNSDKMARISSLGGTDLKTIKGSEYVKVSLPQDSSVIDAVDTYSNDPDVESAQPNYIYRIFRAPNDPLYAPDLWGLHNTGQTLTVDGAIYPNNPGNAGADINMEPVWDKITDCSSVVVAIIDTGVNYNHEDLNANMWDGGTSYPNHGFNFSQGNNDPIDRNGHGTHLAGIIGAVGNNGLDGTGICWKASIMAIRAFDQNGSGTTADIVQGIEFAINHGARIINMSFGQYDSDATLAAEVDKTQTAGLLLIAAAGNDGADMSTTSTTYPCSYTNSNIICVAALDQKDQLAGFSNYGSSIVDVGAPGTNIYSSWFADEVVKETFAFANWTQPAGGAGSTWNHATGSSGADGWVIPNNYNGTSNTYLSNTSRRSYRTAGYSDFSACSYVALGFDASVDLGSASVLNIYHDNAIDNPFIAGTSLAAVTPTNPIGSRYELTACETNTNCSVGFELLANGTTGFGVALFNYYLYCVSATPVSQYFIDHGTSMSTPYVTGLAAILMAYNPSYTYADAKNAILNGGRSVASLSGRTTSGNSIDGWGALTYINAPTGVTAVVQ